MDDEDRQRSVESAVLAIVLERLPDRLTAAGLIEEMTAEANPPGRVEEVERAVAELVRVELLRRDGDRLEPTQAARRMAELETGL
jgi:hypothetical protein